MGFWHIFVSDLFLLRLCGFEECCVLGSYNKSARFQEKDHDGRWRMYLPDCSSTGILLNLFTGIRFIASHYSSRPSLAIKA